MQDALFLAVVITFFALSFGYVSLCDALSKGR